MTVTRWPQGSLSYVAAPMVNQSDLPFRLLTVQYGATATFTQMYLPKDIFYSQDLLESVQRTLEIGRSARENRTQNGAGPSAPQIVQLGGNDPDSLVKAARALADYADGFDLNIGCPQKHAQDGHYGAYLLARKDWPLLEQIVSSLSTSVPLPISTKLRLCVPSSQTPSLAVRLSRAGSRLITLHARHASLTRRRRGAADLTVVRDIRDALVEEGLHISTGGHTAVLSNGNVRTWEDVMQNRALTGADGLMVGDALLNDPSLFFPSLPHQPPQPVAIELCTSYLSLCARYPGTGASLPIIKQHLGHVISHGLHADSVRGRLEKNVRMAESEEEIVSALEAHANENAHAQDQERKTTQDLEESEEDKDHPDMLEEDGLGQFEKALLSP